MNEKLLKEVNPGIFLALQKNPGNPLAKAALRSIYGTTLPEDQDLDTFMVPIPKPPPLHVSSNVRTAGPTRAVDVEVIEREYGTCSYHCYQTYSGELDIPESVIAEGEDEIADYIWDHYRDYMYSETDDYDHDDYESIDSEVTENNVNSAASSLYEEWVEEQGDDE